MRFFKDDFPFNCFVSSGIPLFGTLVCLTSTLKNKAANLLSIISFLVIPSFHPLYGQQNISFPGSYVSIITCGKSDQLYASFGHNAIRIKDPTKNIDLCFNFGTFNFEEPDFYIKFMNGKLMYFLSVSEFEDFKNEYQSEGRSIDEQVLCLNDSEKENIYNYLVDTYHSPRRYYKYDFATNNCSTKIAGVLELLLPKDSFQLKTKRNQGNTVRKYVNNHLRNNDLALVGINMLFGYYADTICSDKLSIFLPDTLETVLDSSTIRGKHLVQQKRFILRPAESLNKSSNKVLRYVLYIVFIADIILLLLFLLHKKANWIKPVFTAQQHLFFLLPGLAGLFFIYMWLFSEHAIVRYNLNLLWCNPLFLFYLIYPSNKWLLLFILTGILAFACIYFNSSYLHIIGPFLGTLSLLLLFNRLSRSYVR